MDGPLGCRTIAKKYNLPSKNYIANWKEQLIKKGLLKAGTVKKDYTKLQRKDMNKNDKTAYEKQLERENFELKARVAYFEELERLINEESKKK